jgi:hypothetical protein
MGDKGGKKDKEKNKQQQVTKHKQEEQKKHDNTGPEAGAGIRASGFVARRHPKAPRAAIISGGEGVRRPARVERIVRQAAWIERSENGAREKRPAATNILRRERGVRRHDNQSCHIRIHPSRGGQLSTGPRRFLVERAGELHRQVGRP